MTSVSEEPTEETIRMQLEPGTGDSSTHAVLSPVPGSMVFLPCFRRFLANARHLRLSAVAAVAAKYCFAVFTTAYLNHTKVKLSA